MRRVVAVLGAVLMVVVALLVRGALDDDGDDGSDGGGGGADGEITLLCVEELEDVCDALQEAGAIDGFETEAAGDTADRMAEEGADLGADGWLTLDPLPGIADVAREESGSGALFGDPARSGFSSTMAVVVHPDRAEALDEACDGEVGWPCLGDLVGDRWDEHGGDPRWGTVKVGIDDPGSSAGLLVAAHAVAAHLELDTFARNDLDASDAVRWIGRFGRGDRVLGQLVTRGAGAFSAVGALDVEARALAATAQGADLGIFYPAPMFRAEVVLAAPGRPADDLVGEDDLADALGGAGWEDETGAGLPSPGALYALRELLS